ncbi:RNA polymerase sigma-70 factor [Phocaeicola sp.]|uniref:RNA polymerase sigma-70 factor n=1 Tax=Phocaeicola sp. TaxID=2773926 RepID=UPI003AB54C62
MHELEELLIKKLRKGDERAFRLLYDRHYMLLCRFANQLLNNAALAEEVVDDVIFYLWEHRQEVEIRYSIRAYLMRAVRNRCLNELQLQSHREELHISSFLSPESMEFLDSLFVDNKQPLGMLLEQELEEELKRSIDELPLECRKVFYKSRFEQKKYEEIATELGISVNTVKYHIKNALAFLQRRLGNYLKLLIVYIFMNS